MKTHVLFLFLSLNGLVACDTPIKSPNNNAMVYTGDFAGEPIELSIIHIDDSSVKGESRHKGQVSQMSGKRKLSEKGYIYHFKELGTSRFEGVFDFELDTSLNLIFGSWQLADTSGKHEAVLYTLKPQLAH